MPISFHVRPNYSKSSMWHWATSEWRFSVTRNAPNWPNGFIYQDVKRQVVFIDQTSEVTTLMDHDMTLLWHMDHVWVLCLRPVTKGVTFELAKPLCLCMLAFGQFSRWVWTFKPTASSTATHGLLWRRTTPRSLPWRRVPCLKLHSSKLQYHLLDNLIDILTWHID